MAKTRTFIGIALPPDVGRRVVALANQLKPLAGGVRWAPQENLHVTLRFIGDLSDQELVEVCSSVKEVSNNADPFTIEVAGVGAFPNLDRPNTLWAGIGSGSHDLTDLQESVDNAVTELGYRGENRRYVPHVTIGKAARGLGAGSAELRARLDELADFSAGLLPVTEITVYASELLREGPEYHVLARCPLAMS